MKKTIHLSENQVTLLALHVLSLSKKYKKMSEVADLIEEIFKLNIKPLSEAGTGRSLKNMFNHGKVIYPALYIVFKKELSYNLYAIASSGMTEISDNQDAIQAALDGNWDLYKSLIPETKTGRSGKVVLNYEEQLKRIRAKRDSLSVEDLTKKNEITSRPESNRKTRYLIDVVDGEIKVIDGREHALCASSGLWLLLEAMQVVHWDYDRRDCSTKEEFLNEGNLKWQNNIDHAMNIKTKEES